MMHAFPPAPADQVTLANWRTSPFNRWAFHHVREIVPSAEIRNDPSALRDLPSGTPLAMPSIDSDAGTLDFEAFCQATDTDGMVVLHKGQVIHESYRNGMDAAAPHILMSVSKSMLGLLAGILAERGILDLEAEATSYVPELETTAFKGATVRHLLDMRTGVKFDEDYLATEGPIVAYRKSTNWNPVEPGESETDLRSFFQTLTESHGPHGGKFDYISPCTDLLGWVIERASGRRYGDVLSEFFWQPLGAETPAYITVDRLGAPRSAGGMCVTTRDLARVGQMVADGGWGIVPESWIEDLAQNGDPAAWDASTFAPEFPGLSMHYRAKWYVFREPDPILMCLGIHGQNLLIDRANELVLAKHASAPTPLDTSGERLVLKLFDAVRERVR